MFVIKAFSIFLFFFNFYLPSFSQGTSDLAPYEIVDKMIVKTSEVKTMVFTMKKKERIKGEYPIQESFVKLNLNPFKIYIKQISPKHGLEVLYVQNKNNNKALINTNGFPWVNIHLDPMGTTMRNNQHHTIFQSGYPHLMSILDHLTKKYQDKIQDIISNKGTIVWDKSECWIIEFESPSFKIINYTVQKGDNVLNIADKMKISEHMVQELNNLDTYDLEEGKVIKVPNDYSPKLELYIDKQEFIPLVMKVYDEKGLYEYYEYTNVKINPPFAEKDFSQENPEYGF